MAQLITNQASVAYEYNGQSASVLSNIATATLNEPLSVEKVSLESVYRFGDEITYSVSFVNSSNAALTGITVTDDLGTYTTGVPGTSVTPLTYVGTAILFLDGVYSGAITPTVADNSVTFSLPTLAAGARAQILYKAFVNNAAPLTEGATITNTALVNATGITTPAQDSNTVSADRYAEVTVTKSMSPANVVDGDALTYTFVINNYGNAPADNIVLRDAFDPAPENITLQLGGVTQPANSYTYEGGILTFPAAGGSEALSLPAATIVQDGTTGIVTVTPSSLTITVTGIL
ncbi:MAG: DUF11 domain-containing protein [Clostridia bacterium]|nr:DUF11 domain-containing protein [Clostridia bacterium]